MGGSARPLYSETQSFRHWHVRVALAFPPLALLIVTCRQIIWHKPWTSPPLSNGDLIFLTVLLTVVYIRLNTVRLSTEVLPGRIIVGLRGLWKRRKIPAGEIRSVAVVEYDPVADFGGYGTRSGRGGTAYIARGNRAVELTLQSGGKFFIGSQNPDELARRIREMLAAKTG
jgi:hypothetical protein